MKKTGLLLLLMMLAFGTALFAQAKTTVKGRIVEGQDKMPAVGAFKSNNGLAALVATAEPAADGTFELSFEVDKPGFYLLGNSKWNYFIYAKGGEVINIDLYKKTAQLTGENTKENETLYQWENLVSTVRWMSSSRFCGEATYKECFPEFTKVLEQVDKLKKKIRSGNKEFDELLRKKIDYDLDSYAMSLIMTPRTAHPERSEWLPYYDTIISDDKFTTDDVLQFPNGVAMAHMYMNFAGLIKAPKQGLDALPNDRLKGEMILVRLYGLKLKTDCEKELAENGHYLSEEQKARAQEIMKRFPESLNGKPAIDFTYPDATGKEVSLSDFKGKVVVVDVWATWCGPCKAEIPYLKKLEEKMHGQDVVFIGVSIDQAKDKQKWADFVKAEGLGGIQLHASGGGQLSKDYSIRGIPRFILIGKDGNIVAESAPRPSSPDLKKMIEVELKK